MATEAAVDYIVVGGGATGCVLVERLSANPAVNVLLLEAGDVDSDPRISDIGGFVQLWGSAIDWQFSTEEQPGLDGRKILINQGKVLGGSTAINAMMYVRGNRRNFDRWQDLGNRGWGYDAILPYFKKSEDFQQGESEFHGVGGPLKVRVNHESASRSDAFMVGATELGYDGPEWDYNAARQENGAGPLQFTIDKSGKRSSAASAFLAPALKRPNVRIETRAAVSRILFNGTHAVGVEYVQGGQTLRMNASREVIVSAGAFQSPKLLMLSGIGPSDHLKAHGIPVVADLPGVGLNLQDHLQLPVVYRSRVEQPMPALLTGNVLFVNTRADAKAAPDLQLNFTPAVPSLLAPMLDFGGPASIFLPILIQPKSRGEVRLRSASPLEHPVINPNYLHEQADVDVFVEAVKLVRALANTKAFSDLYGGELVPGPDGELEPFIRSQVSTLWHPAGTCKMGQDGLSVVDPELRVHGVEALRVADASVMPTVTSGNTLAACYMIGEKAADLIMSHS